MKINILRLPTYYINLYDHKSKNVDTKNLLKSLGFINIKRTPGVLHENPIIGCSLGHESILTKLVNSEDPFIIFEDDIDARHVDHIIEIPDDADAVYLGVSSMGSYNGLHQQKLVAEKIPGYSPEIYRIYNMLGAHAILYINSEYVKETIKIIQQCVELGIPQDVGIAENMQNWNIYCVNRPMFYQRYKYRDLTDTEIEKLNIASTIEDIV